jgi:hypothetical protein
MQRASKRLWERDPSGPYEIREALLAEADVRLMARHVRPLLDALEAQHSGNMMSRTRQANHEIVCEVCRLLAEWKGKP